MYVFCRKVVEVWTNCIWMVTAKWKFLNQTVKKCTQSKHLARFIYIDCVEKAIDKCYSNYKEIYLLFMQSHSIEPTFHCKNNRVLQMGSFPRILFHNMQRSQRKLLALSMDFFTYVISNVFRKGCLKILTKNKIFFEDLYRHALSYAYINILSIGSTNIRVNKCWFNINLQTLGFSPCNILSCWSTTFRYA